MGLADKIKNKGKFETPVCPIPLRPEILLCPNTPKPMHQLAPRNILGRKWWDQTRREAYARTNQHCLACGVHKLRAEYHHWLEGHELYKVDCVRGLWEYVETVALCHFCHNFIHDGRLRTLLDQGKLHHAKYAAIIKHGDLVLKRAGLSRPSHEQRCTEIEEGVIAEWKRWRLILNGKKYKSLFNSYEDWEQHWMD